MRRVAAPKGLIASPREQAGAVRIIAGSLRGSKLLVVDASGLRPTPNRIRETLFNWLARHIPGARALDLFAGTGALAIETISRGAEFVDLVEVNAQLVSTLRSELIRLHCESRASVHHCEARVFLQRPEIIPYQLIYVDPPFVMNLWQESLGLILERGLLSAGGMVYLEFPTDVKLDLANWEVIKQSQAGSLAFLLCRARENAARLS